MKLFHLSDLHVGKIVNGYSMLEEQKHAFEQIISYIKKEKPGVVIIAGDVYDRSIPGAEAVLVFDSFLTALAAESPAVIIISGNHDSPERLSYANKLLVNNGIYLQGAVDSTLRKVVLSDEYGGINFWLLPFVRPDFIRDDETDSYTVVIKSLLDDAGIDYNNRNVLISHQFYIAEGCAPICSDSEINPIGGLDAADAGILNGFDYVALGHLHGAQTVGAERIRYAGSPVKYSFSEWRQKKSITMAELKSKGELTVSLLPLTPIHDMREIRGTLCALSDQGAQTGDKEDYLRIVLTDCEEVIDPMGKLRGIYPRIMSLEFENDRTRIDKGALRPEGGDPRKNSVFELFAEFFLKVSGASMNEAEEKIVKNLLKNEEWEQ